MPPGTLDLLIKDGRVFDGTGSEPFTADIGIRGGVIALVDRKRNSKKTPSNRVVEAAGLIVSPGFIDTHGHSEFSMLADPRAEGKVSQGVTTEINGNCGLSADPLLRDALRQREEDLREYGIKDRWGTLGEYLGILEQKGLVINYATLAGHGNVRASVMGYEDRHQTPAEMEAMKGLLLEALRQGAIGLSTGLIYPPGVFTETEELIELSKCGAKGASPITGGGRAPFIYASHMRSEGSGLLEAIGEAIRIGEEAGVHVHISHIKTSGRDNWHKIDEAVGMIEEAQARGIKITCDRYPYTAASTDLDSVLPRWALEGGNDAVLKRLKDKTAGEKIKAGLLAEHPDEGYWESVKVSSVASDKNTWMEGKGIKEISVELGLNPVDALFQILLEERLRAGGIFYSMDEGNLRRFLKLPYCMVGSDSTARSTDGPTRKGKVHPRGFGSFTRFLGRYVRDGGLIAMAEAVYRITALPAETFGLGRRGRIKEGFAADVVVFDESEIIDRATFDEPFLPSAGIRHVIVNGVTVLSHGVMTGRRPGMVLRHGI
ncbi:MAG: D-aminoacylase [Thermodesulfovibrionales bacterium]|nr:D-aminoacylase [Thermodesulfovibrionales bacterium]